MQEGVPQSLPCFRQLFSPPRFTQGSLGAPRPTKIIAGRSLACGLFTPRTSQPQPKGTHHETSYQQQEQKLLQNGSPEQAGLDHIPVVKLFLPGSGCTWLLTELDPECPDIAFGLCDLGMGFPELGNVSLSEITSVKNKFGLSVERDLYFEAKYPISVYARAARVYSSIVESPSVLITYVPKKRDTHRLG